MGRASPMVRGLSFFEMSRTCPCFHDCGIHTCPSFQITNPFTTSVKILFQNSICRLSVPGDFQTQCHLWWLIKMVFNSPTSWCIPSFSFSLWMLTLLNSKTYDICPTIKTSLFILLTLSQHAQAWGFSAIAPPSLLRLCGWHAATTQWQKPTIYNVKKK